MKLPVQIIAIPLYLLFITIESGWRASRGHPVPRDQVRASLLTGLGYVAANAGRLAVIGGLFGLAWRGRIATLSLDAWWGWALAFLGVELAHYWEHRLGHAVRFMWASHAVHHTSEDLNLSAALRNGWTDLFSLAVIPFLVLAACGVHPAAIGLLVSLNQIYGFFLHTEVVGRLGPLDWVLNTPSNHRVHHAVNPQYMGRNFGAVLIVFDRLFGTFAPEDPAVPPRYGVQPSFSSSRPVELVFHEWVRMGRDFHRATGIGRKLLVLIRMEAPVPKAQMQPTAQAA